MHRVRPRALAAWLGAAIIAVCVAGVLLGHERDLAIFSLLEEQTLPALFTAFLLALAAGFAFAARRTGSPWVWLAIAGFLLVMAGDEVFAVHESVRGRLPGGTASYLVLLPYAALGCYLWVRVLRRLSGQRSAVVLWVGAAALWGASQLLDAFAVLDESVRAGALPPIEVAEETLEMSGSALFVVALVAFLQRAFEPSVSIPARRADLVAKSETADSASSSRAPRKAIHAPR